MSTARARRTRGHRLRHPAAVLAMFVVTVGTAVAWPGRAAGTGRPVAPVAANGWRLRSLTRPMDLRPVARPRVTVVRRRRAASRGALRAPLPPEPAAPTSAAMVAVHYALAHLGAPYVWGAAGPTAFDCSGLAQAAYAAAGIGIPRTSEAQYAALPSVPLADLRPGDLVFSQPGEFGPGPGHVSIYIGGEQVVDAPYTGGYVRIDPLWSLGSIVGATRP